MSDVDISRERIERLKLIGCADYLHTAMLCRIEELTAERDDATRAALEAAAAYVSQSIFQWRFSSPWHGEYFAKEIRALDPAAIAASIHQNPSQAELGKHKEPTMKHVDSTSDDRTANNAVRHQYRVLTDTEKQQMVDLKDLGAAFISKCQEIGGSREMSLAITNAEQAVMWAVKHVTK